MRVTAVLLNIFIAGWSIVGLFITLQNYTLETIIFVIIVIIG
jgi:hypothetical protein